MQPIRLSQFIIITIILKAKKKQKYKNKHFKLLKAIQQM